MEIKVFKQKSVLDKFEVHTTNFYVEINHVKNGLYKKKYLPH